MVFGTLVTVAERDANGIVVGLGLSSSPRQGHAAETAGSSPIQPRRPCFCSETRPGLSRSGAPVRARRRDAPGTCRETTNCCAGARPSPVRRRPDGRVRLSASL